ncbi:MAG: TlpA disulfide reductase family protein [Methylococcaceae bacterium]|jgi:thiol-disulfide isomerase/thioredoxin
MKRSVLIVLVAMAALLAGILSRQHPQLAQPMQNQPLLDFSFPDVAGAPHSITEWQGKLLIINFWATWCPPCLKEIPVFVELQEHYANHGVQFIGIAIEDRAVIEEFMANNKINYPMLAGENAAISISQKLGNLVNAVPFSIVVNRQNQIILIHPGEFNKQQLTKIIENELNSTVLNHQ